MSPEKRRRWRRAALVVGLLGCLSFGQGLWIEAKALAAQVLLERAWQKMRTGETRARPWPWADTWPVARIEVPRLGVRRIVLSGASGAVLAFGPGYLEGTGPLGGAGNSVVSGHRDTHFEFLRRLRPGDVVSIETPDGGRRIYTVESARVVREDDVSALAPSADPVLTLLTCYPFDALVPGGPLRYVVRARAASA